MHKTLIPIIFEEKKPENMKCFEKIAIEMIDTLKILDHDLYERTEYKLYKMVYGEHLNRELAEKWVSKMENKDGTIGAHWTYEQTSQYADNFNKNDCYAVMNMMYSDHYNIRFDTSTYIELAKDFIKDKDAKDGKILNYYLHVVLNE